MGLRDRRARDTRRRIFASASELFSADGYHGTPVERIVARAGVAKGTFFVHFPTKGAIVTELVRLQVHSALRARERVVGDGADPSLAIWTTIVTMGRHASANRALSRAVIAASLESEELAGETAAVLEELRVVVLGDARRLSRSQRTGMTAEKFVAAVMTAYYGAVLYWCSNPAAPPLDEAIVALSTSILNVHPVMVREVPRKERRHAKTLVARSARS